MKKITALLLALLLSSSLFAALPQSSYATEAQNLDSINFTDYDESNGNDSSKGDLDGENSDNSNPTPEESPLPEGSIQSRYGPDPNPVEH